MAIIEIVLLVAVVFLLVFIIKKIVSAKSKKSIKYTGDNFSKNKPVNDSIGNKNAAEKSMAAQKKFMSDAAAASKRAAEMNEQIRKRNEATRKQTEETNKAIRDRNTRGY